MYLPTPIYKVLPYAYIGIASISGYFNVASSWSKLSSICGVILILLSILILWMRKNNSDHIKRINQYNNQRNNRKSSTKHWDNTSYRR